MPRRREKKLELTDQALPVQIPPPACAHLLYRCYMDPARGRYTKAPEVVFFRRPCPWLRGWI
jgi:hypothetical protein